jgi:hypothetical protein
MSDRNYPPCPGDPRDYQLIHTKEDSHWRRRRGTVKPATLNDDFKEGGRLLKLTAPAAKIIRQELRPFTHELQMGRLNNRISTELRHDLRGGHALYHHLLGMDLQPAFPLERILLTPYEVQKKGNEIIISIRSEKDRVRAYNRLVTEYYFTSILLCGDPLFEKSLESASISSPLFSFSDKNPKTCLLALPLPDSKPWILFLKVSCLEGNELAVHHKHYGMKAIAVSGRNK